jgi:hypothetical protein
MSRKSRREPIACLLRHKGVSVRVVRLSRRGAVLLAVGCAALTSCASLATDADSGQSASCAAVVVYRGHTYRGQAPVKQDPATTGRLVRGAVPGCDDSGGTVGIHAEPARLAELADVPVETALLFNGVVYVRRGGALPAAARTWFKAPRCSSTEPFALTADWIGVTGPGKPRFDGDLRPPYRLDVHVRSGPKAYVGATVQLDADAATDPRLRPRDVKGGLWKGGQVAARISCVDGRFHALALRVPTST